MKATMMPNAMSRPNKRQRSSIGEAYPRYASLLEDIASTTAGSSKSNRVCSTDWVKDLKDEYNPNLDVTRVFLDDSTEFTNKRVRSGGVKQNLHHLNYERNSRLKFNDDPMRVPSSAFSSSLDDELKQVLKLDQAPANIRSNEGASHRFTSWDKIESVIEQELSDRKPLSENNHRVTTGDWFERELFGGDDSSTTRVVSEDESSGETDNEADGKERKPQEMPREWNDNDVLFGRGGLSNHHPGNKIYREKVKELKPQYKMSVKVQKNALSRSVVDYIYELGGRFLLYDEKSGRWTEANNTQARRKVAQAFREGEGRRK